MTAWSEALSLGSKVLDLTRDWLARRIPKKTLVIVPCDFQPPFVGSTFWSVATFAGSPSRRGMFIRFTFTLRNVARQPVRVVRPRLKIKRRHWGFVPGRGQVIDGKCFMQPDPRIDVYGDHPVAPQGPAVKADAHWLVESAVVADGESFIGKVCLVDDFGIEHWTDKLRFRPLGYPTPATSGDAVR